MPRNFCTLFDSNYLSRGVAMAQSLVAKCPEAHLFVFGFDDRVCEVLRRLKLPSVTVITLAEFENADLLRVKPTRSAAEYCWTSTPYTIQYCLDRFELDECTYIDADMIFYSDPSVLLDEMGDASVLIPPHRYTPEYDQSATSGIYCVQFVTFRNTIEGRAALNWWRDACLEWCYARLEPGRFGDQKYLDDWPARFQGVHVLQHLGGGIAPWNVQQYRRFDENEGNLWVESATGNRFEPVFFHFHHLRYYSNGTVEFGPYRLSLSVLNYFYKPYVRVLSHTFEQCSAVQAGYDYHGSRAPKEGIEASLKRVQHRLEGRDNLYTISEFIQ